MKILVTGGAGFIGSHVTELLCDQNYKVFVFDNLSKGYREFVDSRAGFIHADLTSFNDIFSALKGVDLVVHLAATCIISESIENPVACFKNNIENGINLLEAMRKRGIKMIVNSSTAAVYGEPGRIPVKEDDPKEPVNPYGASKLAFEEILSCYYHTWGINSVSLRYFNAYGPRDEQKPATRAVSVWIKATLKNKGIPLYWQGKQIRDYIFVKDIAEAHLAVMNLKGFNYFNIGSGTGIVMKVLLKEIFKAIGRKTKIIDKGERYGDPQRLVADISKIEKIVGWQPKITLEEGIKKTVKYYRQSLKIAD